MQNLAHEKVLKHVAELKPDATPRKGLWVLPSSMNTGKTVLQLRKMMEDLGLGGFLKITTPDIMALEKERDALSEKFIFQQEECDRISIAHNETKKERDALKARVAELEKENAGLKNG